MMKHAAQMLSVALMALALIAQPAPALAARDDDVPSMPVVSDDPAREELDDLALRHVDALDDGTHALASTLEGGYALAADSAGAVTIAQDADAADASWVISHDETGYVTVEHAASGQVLGVASGSAREGAPVRLLAADDSWAQRWVAVSEGGGFVLVSALDRALVLDVSGDEPQLRGHDGSAT